MNILIISPFRFYPTYSGYATREFNLIRCLSKKHKLTVLYTDYGGDIAEYSCKDLIDGIEIHSIKVARRWMQLIHPMLILNGLRLIRREKANIIISEGLWGGLHSFLLSFLTRVPYLLDEHNAEYIRWKRMGKRYSSLIELYENGCCRFAEKVICVSGTDKQFIQTLGVDERKIFIVPNGVDISKFRPNAKAHGEIRRMFKLNEKAPIIFFSGDLKYPPNRQAVQIICQILMPKILSRLPDAKFMITGKSPPEEYKHESIIFTGAVERIEDFINASDVVIAPLISGGGTKLKIVEAIACGKTVVTTSIGAEGLTDGSTEKFLRISDDWDEYVSEVIDAAENSGQADIPEHFINCYSWSKIGEMLDKAISSHGER